jgi:hypothetical protein
MDAGEQVDVGRHDPDLEEAASLLTDDHRQVGSKKARHRRINELLPIPCCPHDVYVEANSHSSRIESGQAVDIIPEPPTASRKRERG